MELNLRTKIIVYFIFVSLLSVVSIFIYYYENLTSDAIDYLVVFCICLVSSSLIFLVMKRFIFLFVLPSIILYERIIKKQNTLISERKTQLEFIRKWELEADASGNKIINYLSLEAKQEMESLEKKYIHSPSAKTTLALAKFYEKIGVRALSRFYYDQLFAEYRWAKETRELQKSRDAR